MIGYHRHPYGPFEEMALVVEGVVSRGVDVQEALC